MLFSIELLQNNIIKPCLSYVELDLEHLDRFLIAVLLCSKDNTGGFGAYHITHTQHWDLWDTFLVHRPALASKIRGLASQRRFLEDPDAELNLNLGYATAITAYLILREYNLKPQNRLKQVQLVRSWIKISPNTDQVLLENMFENLTTNNVYQVA